MKNLLCIFIGLLIICGLGYLLYILSPTLITILHNIDKFISTPTGVTILLIIVFLTLIYFIISSAYWLGKKIIDWFM